MNHVRSTAGGKGTTDRGVHLSPLIQGTIGSVMVLLGSYAIGWLASVSPMNRNPLLIAIRTDPNDGRSHSISLTPRGRTTHDKVIVAALDRERRLMSCLDESEQEVLIDLLRRLHNNLGAVTGQT